MLLWVWVGTSDLSFTIIVKTQQFWQKIFIINAPATWGSTVQSNYVPCENNFNSRM